MTEKELIKAKQFALRMHREQVRPNLSQESKWVHLAEVAQLTSMNSSSEAMIAAAWLHDVVEDTPTTLEMILTLFGKEIYHLVDELSDPEPFAAMSLRMRKEKQIQRILYASPQAKVIKLSDQISNIQSVIHDPPVDWDEGFSSTYIEMAIRVGQACSGVSKFLDQYLETLSQNHPRQI